MDFAGYSQKIQLTFAVSLLAMSLHAQVNISGTIYDRSLRSALAGVTVNSSSGKNSLTDGKGNYRITLAPSDSIWFSYLNKRTQPYAVKAIEYPQAFDMSLDIASDSLPPVTVWSKNYYQDSVENRKEYEKVFNYGGMDVLATGSNYGQASSGFNLDMFFSAAKMRRMEAFQKRLIADEQDRYINHKFTRSLVALITGLEPPALDSFMKEYRPKYDQIQAFETEYDYYKYIKKCSVWFKEDWTSLHPDIPYGVADSTRVSGRVMN